MDNMDKLWTEVDGLKETRTRHDERIRRLESDHKETMKHLSSVEAGLEDFRAEIREGFQTIGKRIDDIEGNKRENDGYKKGKMDALKTWGAWFAILTFVAGVIMWSLNK